MSTDAITSVIYDEKDPIFLKIREKFKEKLTTLFACEDYDQIIKYVFDGVFKDKTPKKKCIIDFEPIFHDKTTQLMGYLWDLVEKTVNESKNKVEVQEENVYEKANRKRRNNNFRGNKRMKMGSKEVILHKRERSRSNNSNNNFNDDEYQGNYQRSFYNQRGRFNNMIGMGGRGGYGFYPIMTPFIQSRPFFPSKVKHPKPKEQNQEVQNVENTKTEEKENVQNDEEHKNIIDTESFKKMSQEEQKQILEKREAKKKVRCKNWPNCKDPNCEYTHPTQTCPFFPNCMFGDKCSYIHPNVPCKYGFYCTRIGCSYSHPAGWNPGMGMYPNVMHPIPFKGKKKHVVNEEGKDNNNNNNTDLGNLDNKNDNVNNNTNQEGNVETQEPNQIQEEQKDNQ